MLRLCSSNNNALQKSGVLVVNDMPGIGCCGIKVVARHLVLNHLVGDPVLVLILVILSHIPSLKLKVKVVKGYDQSGMRNLLFSLGCSLFSKTLGSSCLEVCSLLCQTWSAAENTVGKQTNYGEWFEPRSHFKSRLSLIVQVNVVVNRTVVDDSD